MTNSPPITWRFAPTSGGAEQGNSAGQYHFANDAVTKMVREILQNSLDHPAPGIDIIDVVFRLIQVTPEDIGAEQLKEHISSSLQEVTEDRDTDAIDRYQKMLRAISQPRIPCLAVIDSGTTGLPGKNWRNLILREGTPTNTEGQTKGGSFGFGKNAPFNLSACNTVIYSTRYVSIPEKGRVEHMAGRSQLVSHDHPHKPGFRLQQTGFLAAHQDSQPNQPVAGPEIPQPFRLNHQGTGIFVIAFDSYTYHNWVAETAKATATQFFYAIHVGKMAVTIDQGDGAPPRVINHDTLEMELENCPQVDPTRHYYRAIVEQKPEITEPSGQLGQMGQVLVWIDTAKDAPRRTAHINRRGMLITDGRQFASNPFYPNGGAGWIPWCAVTMAADEDADRVLRRMEPPAHDAIHYRLLRSPSEQEFAETELRKQNKQVTDLVKSRIAATLNEASKNVGELADLFPDIPALGEGVHVITHREVKHSAYSGNNVNAVDNDEGDDPGDDSEETQGTGDSEETQGTSGSKETQGTGGSDDWQETGNGGGGGAAADGGPGGSGASTGTEPNIVRQVPSERTISKARIIRTAPRELTMTLVTPHEPVEQVTFGIRTAGEQYQKYEETVPIESIGPTGNMLVKATLVENSIVLSAPPDMQIKLRLQLDSDQAPYHSYAIVHTENRETAK